MYRIVVVGGGMSGLAAAWQCSRGGAEVLLLEASDRVGGTLRRESVAGHLVDVGAESMLATRPEALDLIREIGADDLVVAPATTSASVYSYGALHPMPPRSLMGIPRTPDDAAGILNPADLARLASPVLLPPLSGDVSVGDHVARALGDAVVDRLVEPLLGGVYAGHAHRISLAAALPQVYAAAVAGEPLTATVQRQSASRTTTSPGGSPFAGLRGGMGLLPVRLAEALAEAGVTVRTGVTVRHVARGNRGGWQLTTGPTIEQQVVGADAVILATPPAATRRLLGPLSPVAASHLGSIETASVAVVTMAFPMEAMPQLHGSGFLVPPVEGRTIKASTFSSSKWDWLADSAPEVSFVRASIGRQGGESVLQRPDHELLQVALGDLSDILALRLPAPVDWHVQRWGGGLPLYAVGHVQRIRLLRNEIATMHGLGVAGAAYDGVGVPAVVGSGRRAARERLAAAGLRD